MKNVTMRDIGAALGVSTVTISKALGGKEGVSDSVREKIIETARQMGYRYGAPQPDIAGKVIGILISERFFESQSFYLTLYKALVREVAEAGMVGVLESVSEADEAALAVPMALGLQKASGFVLLGQLREDYVASILETGLPVVLLDFTCECLDVDAVVSDGQSGCFQMTRYLIERGHRDIGFVGAINRTTSIMDRYSGYLRAMKINGLPVRDEWTLSDGDAQGHYVDRLRLPETLPTAFVCNNDMIANALERLLIARGLRVPEDISLTGFDDFVYGEAHPLTTYAVDQQRMAQVTVRRMLSRMREGMEGSLRTCVGGWFVERDTVRDLREQNKEA